MTLPPSTSPLTCMFAQDKRGDERMPAPVSVKPKEAIEEKKRDKGKTGKDGRIHRRIHTELDPGSES